MSEEEVFFARKASGLVRELTPLDAAIWAFGVAAVSGITFYSCRMPYRFPGADPTLSFFISSAILLPAAVALALMMGTMPRSGGLYVAISRVIGPEVGFLSLWSIVIGWGILLGLWGIVSGRLFGSVFIMAGLVDIGSFLQTPVGAFLWGIFWLTLFALFSMLGIKWIKWVTRITSYIPLIAIIIACILFVVFAPNALTNFSKAWNVDANALINAAYAAGYTKPEFSWSATIASFVIPLWAWTGFEAITYAGGEIKSPKASAYGFLGGFFIVWALYTIIPACLFYAWGDLIGPYAWLFNAKPDVLKAFMTVTEPSVPFFAYSIVGGGIAGFILALAIMMLYLKGLPPVFGATSRMLFALGFDRALPPKISEVDKRGSPRLSVAIMYLIGIFGLVIADLGIDAVLGILDYTMLGFFWFLGIALMLLPYRKREIYEVSPFRAEIGGIPLMVIVGLLTVGTGFFVAAFSIMEFDYIMACIMAIIYCIGFALYAWQQHRNAKEGIDTSKIYSTLPPL
jgi:amino acid transporter